ncbi:MAG: branched-chain amino acid ABC transporter substrate-binding protein [Solirubrobacterales bacterium]
MAGCGSSAPSGPVTLTVYVSLPLGGERAADGLGAERGARLALERAGGRVGDLRIRATYLDDTGGGPRWSQAASGANARRAAQDSTAIGYVGDLDSGATRVSMPITNQAEIPQVSPGASADDLAAEVPGEPDPSTYRPSGDRTFARVVPADRVQAETAARLAVRLGADRGLAVSGGDPQGRELARAFAAGVRREGLPARVVASLRPAQRLPVSSIVGTPPSTTVFYAGATEGGLRWADLVAKGGVISTDAAMPFAGEVCRGFREPSAHYVTSPFIAPSRLGVGAAAFLAAYRRRWGPPPPAAAYGYEAMSVLLGAIRRAGAEGEDRGTVVDELLATRVRQSTLGAFTIGPNGETSLRRVSVYRLHGCRPVLDD